MEIEDFRLAKELGIPKQNVNKMKNNTISVVPKRLIAFLGRHRNINVEWILFGDGEMFGKPGIHKFTMSKSGDMQFSSEVKTAEREDIKTLQTFLEDKIEQVKILTDIINHQKEQIKNQDLYIKKLMEKL